MRHNRFAANCCRAKEHKMADGPERDMEILMDCDGVAADFSRAICKPISEATGVRHNPETITSYHYIDTLPADARKYVTEAILSPGFCRNIPVFPDAQLGISALAQVANVTWVTSPWKSPTWMSERLQWIAEHFGTVGKNVIFTSPATLKAKAEGDLMVDDVQDTLVRWLKVHPGVGVLWEQPHNRADRIEHPRIVRTGDWGLVRRLVEWSYHYGYDRAVGLAKECQGVDFHVKAG